MPALRIQGGFRRLPVQVLCKVGFNLSREVSHATNF
jgi:hypothetical protein